MKYSKIEAVNRVGKSWLEIYSIMPFVRLALELNNIDRSLYLAIPTLIYEAFFQKEFLKISVERYQIKLIIYEPVSEVIEKWIN